MLIRLLYVFIASLLLISCSNNEKPSVEILGTVQGVGVRGEDGKFKLKEPTDKILRSGDAVVWYVYLRTNMKSVRYTEEVTMSASSVWGMDNKSKKNDKTKDEDIKTIDYKISDDGSKIIVLKEAKNLNGFIVGTWKMTDKDAVGPVKIRVTVENQVNADFSWELVKDEK